MAQVELPGSSLVAAVLEAVEASSGRLDKESLGRRIARLSERVEELKDEVCCMIKERYVEFLPSMQNAKELESEAEELSSSISQLKSVIETEVQQDLNVAIAEFTELKQQLERDTLILGVLKQLQEFDSALKKSTALLPEKKYVPAACHLKKAQRCLELMESRRGFELKILRAFHVELVTQTENLLGVLGQEWQQLAVWKLPQSKEPGSVESALQTELRAATAELHPSSPLICHPSLQSHQLEEQPGCRRAAAGVLGELIWKELADCLTDYLVHSIPNSSSKLGRVHRG
uniref:Uncharacterized protein n=1 Tax=Sphaerodactylus townsendi TaxID=933632 RepID=A0ACB8EZ82_9SAUR